MIQRSFVNNFKEVTSKTKKCFFCYSKYHLLFIARLFDFTSVFVKMIDLLFTNFEKISNVRKSNVLSKTKPIQNNDVT